MLTGKDETLFPEELRPVFQGRGAATAVVHRKRYNLDDFLETANEDYTLEQREEEIQGPTRAEIIRNEEDDELEPIPADPDADEDLNEDDYGTHSLLCNHLFQVRITSIMAKVISMIMRMGGMMMSGRYQGASWAHRSILSL